jgi:tRNA(adenine34) deaminase
MDTPASDIPFFERAIELALQAEQQGNLPIGAVICLDGEIVGEGRNAIWVPARNPNRHAEVEALRSVPEHLWDHSHRMTLYTTLEPCLMCMGAILLHRIGRVLYGSADHYGGASLVIGHMPTFFEDAISQTEWHGPAYPAKCDKLFERVMIQVEKQRS